MTSGNVEDRIRDLVTPLLDDLQVQLFDVEYNGGRLKVTIEAEGGLDTGTLYLATKAVSRELDAQDPISGTYTLEVSSPGLERNLRRPAHWQRSIGEKVSVKVNQAFAGDSDRRMLGSLTAASETAATVALPDGTEIEIPYAVVQKARTVFEWGPAPKPGGKSKQAGSKSSQKSPKKSPKNAQSKPQKKAGAS